MTIYNLGSINIDHVYMLKRIPKPGETLSALESLTNIGGKGLNISAAAYRAGADVRHIGIISAADPLVLEKILDYGVCEVGIESTVVDCRGKNPIILRHGAITETMIFNVTNTKALALNKTQELISPGLLKSHYAPNAKVLLNQKNSMLLCLIH